MSRRFLNFTDIDDKEAKEIIKEKRDLVLRGESDRKHREIRDEENNNFWLNNIWTDEEINDFVEAFDVRPYNVPVQRPLINNIISKQRKRKISFDFVPSDIHSYKRHRRGREEFIQKEMNDPSSSFMTSEEAGEYYDKYADDKYASAVTAMLHNLRSENKAKFIETEIFQQGIISGLDFFKCIYSRKHNRNGGIEIARRPQRAVFYDESSTEYDLSDIEFIGEIHKLYKNQLKVQYPDYSEDIEEFFKEYTNTERPLTTSEMSRWRYFYDFNYTNTTESQLRVAEVWCLENETRLVIHDNEENDSRVVKYGKDEDEVYDDLMSMVLIELTEKAKTDPDIAEMVESPEIKNEVARIVDERFELNETVEPIWYKAVFSYNCLFEYRRSPLPHNSHPYFPFFAQFTEGQFTSLMDDIKDVVIAINKALAFRELMMSHGAKGLVVIDEKTFSQSGYSVDEVADQYASVGGVLALKLKPHQDIRSAIDTLTTVGDGMQALNSLLADLDNRLFHISGVTMEQLGVTQRQTTASGFRQQVNEGETNNGLLFDNFYRSMETFYNDKVIPLIVETMNEQPKRVIRRLGDNHKPWIEIDLEEDFNLFDDAVRTGQYNTVLRPITDNPQIQEERSSKYMEMAMGGLLDPEIALEFSTDPDRFKIIRRMKEKEKAKEMNTGEGQQEQYRQGAVGQSAPQQIGQEASESQRLQQIERDTLT